MIKLSSITANLIIEVDSKISYFALNDAMNKFIDKIIKEKIK